MRGFSPEELAQWLGCTWSGAAPAQRIGGICHDTRSLQPGDLYVAIRGERFDGHDFVEQAFGKGAAGALVAVDFPDLDRPLLKVADTLCGLQDLARGYRSTWSAHVVGITGSVGKTTVKEMCADVLCARGLTHRTNGNFNNHIGLPLSMLSMSRTAAFGVFELGMSFPGEIKALAELLRPDTAIITDICNAHREQFDSLEAIAQEKAALVAAVPENGRVILDADSPWFNLMRAQTEATVISISFEGEADYSGRAVLSQGLEVAGAVYQLSLPGEHIMRNALRAIALGLESGLAPDQIAESLRRFSNAPMRWEESDVAGLFFINDAYNANPLSMRASLRTFSALSGSGAKWAVLGGMRELGAAAEREHAEVGRLLDELELDGVVAVGPLATMIQGRRKDLIHYCTDADAAADYLREHLQAGDRVLLKASRGERLEQILDFFGER